MKPKEEYLFYMQKFFDLTENIKDEELRQNLITTVLKITESLSIIANFDLDSLNSKEE